MPGTAIFDLDRTVTRLGTWTRFVFFANGARPGFWLRLPLLLARGIAGQVGLADEQSYKRYSLRLLAWMPIEALAARADAFVAREVARGLRPGAVAAIRRHRAAGDRLILATACVDLLGDRFGRMLGFDEVLATPMAPPTGGRFDPRMAGATCQGAEKLRRVQESLSRRPPGMVHAYSDHISDLALLRRADRGVAVNPSRRLRQAAAALAIPVVDFDAGEADEGRIGFLFNHDQTHQIAHSLPIALALAARGGPYPISVITTNRALAAEVRRLAGAALGQGLTHREIRPRRLTRLLGRVLGAVVPVDKLLIYRDNLDVFRSLAMLVVPEKTSLILKRRYGLDHLRIVHTRHGAGDRAIGFDPASAGFDHVFCAGPKYRDRLIREAGVDPARISIVGYPKFDLPPRHARLPVGFDPARPTVLYNPHPSPHLSSWFREGLAVLDFFADHPAYQLIFAPHVMLFQRPFVLTIDRLRLAPPGRIPDRHRRAPNIYIDLGSPASTDMSYTTLADIYLGDVSSQVYEFLLKPRPCLFLNAHQVDWHDDPSYLHWQAGPVIGGAAGLEEGLRRAIAEHPGQYRAVQERLFAQNFDLTDEPSSVRAAREIERLMDARAPQAAGP